MKFKKLVIATGLILSMSAIAFNSQSDAATTTHKVQPGETYWQIAANFGVPVNSLVSANHAASIYPGENLLIPNSPVSVSDKDLMARLVHAEAQGEPFAGQVAVATVILNRVKSANFPNTVPGVIYQIANGHYAFTTVQNGRINQSADATSRAAVNEAIAMEGQGSGSLFFYNPKTTTNSWILSRQVTCRIGNHVFAK